MMSKKSPQLRFEGFTDDWEERKLSDGTNKIGDGLHGTPKYSEDGEVYFVNGNNLVNGQIVIMPETKRVTSNEQSKDDKALNESTILMSINGTIGNLAWYRGENLMLGKSAAYIEVSDFDKKFIYAYLQTRPVKDYYLNSLTGTTIKNLGLKAIRNTNICTPTIDEQAKIGSFFKKLDDTIALHQRKLDLLKEQKKGYLQKMFPKNGAKVPELRFAGFADDWEERKLGDVGDTFTGLTGKTKEDFGHGSAKFVTYVNVFQNPIATLDQLDAVEIDEKQNQVQKGDVFFTTSSETPEEVGMSSVWTYDTKNVYLNSFTFGYRPRVSFDLNYMASMLRSPSIRKKITFLAQGISRYNISKTKMLEIEIPAPNLSEQKKIGSFFKLLDDTIALHQRKLDLLKEQKKGYLQKMFPKNGARVPELRFAGFADDWEQRKLKELFQPSKNKNNNGLYNQKDILAASLGTELIPKRTFFGLKSTKESVKNYRIVKTGDLIYTKSPIKGFPNGIIRSNKGNVGIVPPLYCVYTLQKDINSSIIQLYFEDKNRLDFYLFPLVNVGARNNVNITDLEFLEGKVTIPKSYEEQSKIVQFMEQLNTTIVLHQRKLDLLKEQKKGFLQKMFV